MRSQLIVVLTLTLFDCTKHGVEAPVAPETSKKAIAAVLDDFHRAASEPDEERYFAHFAPGAVFLGTDPAERWTVQQFRAYAHERFSAGVGWTYLPSQRNVDLATDGDTAWFDEVVTSEKYGACRGTGAMVRGADAWKIAQYSLSLPLPNDMFGQIAQKVMAQQ